MTEPAVRRASIRDVAAQVGISVSTVSRALNGYADVSAETHRRVEQAAEQLDQPAFRWTHLNADKMI